MYLCYPISVINSSDSITKNVIKYCFLLYKSIKSLKLKKNPKPIEIRAISQKMLKVEKLNCGYFYNVSGLHIHHRRI